MKRLNILLAILGLFAASVAHADETISLKAGYMSLTPSGNFSANLGALGATQVDVKNDLAMKKSNNVMAEAQLSLGDSVLSVGYLPIKFEGSNTLTRNVTFQGVTYPATTTVNSKLDAKIYDVGYTYYLVNMDDLPSRFQFGVEVAVKGISAEAAINNNTASASAYIPTIGLRARVALADFIGVLGRVGYIGYAGNRFMDMDAQVEFSPLPAIGIFAGYRQLDLKVDTNSVVVDTKFAGPYGGALVRF